MRKIRNGIIAALVVAIVGIAGCGKEATSEGPLERESLSILVSEEISTESAENVELVEEELEEKQIAPIEKEEPKEEDNQESNVRRPDPEIQTGNYEFDKCINNTVKLYQNAEVEKVE